MPMARAVACDARRNRSLPVLRVTDMFHPVDNFTVEPFLNGDMRHRRRRCGAVPVLLAGCDPHHVTGPDLLNRPALALRPPAAGGDDEGLTEWMRMPCSPRAGLECYARTLNTCGIGCLNEWIDPYGASEPLRRTLCGRLRANS